jgi:DME family drug/metabolite transporter
MLAAAAWSTAGVFVSTIASGSGLNGIGLAFWRCLATCLVLGLYLLATDRERLRVSRSDLPWLAGMGGLAIGPFQALWIMSALVNGAAVSTVIGANAPVIVTLLAWVFWHEPLRWRKWAAIGLALLGTLAVASPFITGGARITPGGLALALGAATAYAMITLFTKPLAGRHSPATTLTYAFGFAALALLPFQIGRPLPRGATPDAWAAFAALIGLTTIAGYASYTLGLRRLPASVASIIAMVEVPCAAVLAGLFLGERLAAVQWLGALAVMGGVAILALGGRTRGSALSEQQASVL